MPTNCYSYALNCDDPLPPGNATKKGQTSLPWPGANAKANKVEIDGDSFVDRLINGVEADLSVTIPPKKRTWDIVKVGAGENKVPKPGGGQYVVALAVNSGDTGFHFFKCGDKGKWTWKMGADATIYKEIGDLSKKVKKGKGLAMIPVTDAVLLAMFNPKTSKNYFVEGTCKDPNYKLAAFFVIPDGKYVVRQQDLPD